MSFIQFQPWMKRPSGYHCPKPVIYEFQSEAYTRDCGYCPRCIAAKKRDVSGRCAAEAYTSAEVVVWTLTYKPGEPGALDFVVDDRQRFLKRVRDWLHRHAAARVGRPKRLPNTKAGLFVKKTGKPVPVHQAWHVKAYWKHRVAEFLPVVRFMGCGERGKRSTKRCHWHVVLFLTKPSGFVSTPRDKDGGPGRENHDLWPHGFVNIHVLPQDMHQKMQAVRYAVKYLDKSRPLSRTAKLRGVQREAMFFRSLRTPLGYAYLTDFARRHVQAGLPVDGTYRVPGVRFSRGQAQETVHVLSGRMRDHYVEAYAKEWLAQYGERDIPMSDFLMRYDPNAVFRASPATLLKRVKWKKRGEVARPIPVVPRRDRSGLLKVQGPRGYAGMVELLWSGYCQFEAPDGVIHPVPHGNIRDLARLSDDTHLKVEAWIKQKRGPDWVDPRELRVMRYRAGLARRNAIESFAKRAPRVVEPHVVGALEPLTGLYRKLLLYGNGHVPGSVVQNLSLKGGPFVRRKSGLGRPVSLREC